MSKRVKDFVEVRNCTSLDGLIEQLVAARDALPPGHDAEVKMAGDDVFGRRLSIAYFRPQTPEEAECDARYAEAYRESRERELARLEAELELSNNVPHRRRAGRAA